jgi:erythromycin esterase-like protein
LIEFAPPRQLNRWAAKLNIMKTKPDAQVVAGLEAVRNELLSAEPSAERVRLVVMDLLKFLASRKGRTDSNVRFVDYGLSNDDDVWDRIELIEAADPILADVVRDMAGALHDTVKAPYVARNFDSTPEQLLARLAPPAHVA